MECVQLVHKQKISFYYTTNKVFFIDLHIILIVTKRNII